MTTHQRLMAEYRSISAAVRAFVCIACASFASFASAGAQQPARTMITYAELQSASRKAPDAERISYGTETLQFGELRLPSGTAPVPLVVFLHGGCWLSAYTLEHTRAFTAAFAQAGYAVWSPEYRRVGDVNGGWPGTFDDVASAVDFVPQLVARHPRLDASRVVIMGHSAGGQLALWVAGRQASDKLHLRGVVSLAGITNLAQYGAERGGCNAAVDRLMGGTADEQPERYAAVDPMRMQALTMPLRLVHGELDPTVPLDQSRSYSEKNRAAGGTALLEVIPAAGHFDLVSPEGEAWLAVLRAVHTLAPLTGIAQAPVSLLQQRSRAVVPGIEVLLSDSLHLVQGKRVGLLTNHSGRDRQGTSTADLLHRAPGVQLTALFGPEHGIRGEARAGDKINSSVDASTGVKVYSLYGDVQVPTPEMFATIDVLLYDIQDVGARVYTFEWTLANTAKAAKAANIPIIVLDRPNPIRADRVEGNILDPTFASLVGQYPVALRYGLTPGELMRYLVGAKMLDADVTVIPMKNYSRAMWFDETGIPRVNPSPNLRTLDAELLYPGTVFFEGTTVTEGRGTESPFTLIGASWLTDHVVIAAELNAMRLRGVRFDTATRTIEAGYKFAGQTIPMIHIHVTDRNAVRPVEVGMHMLRAIYVRHPREFTWRTSFIDRLAGTDQLRKAVETGTMSALITTWNSDAARFRELVKPYLLYQ